MIVPSLRTQEERRYKTNFQQNKRMIYADYYKLLIKPKKKLIAANYEGKFKLSNLQGSKLLVEQTAHTHKIQLKATLLKTITRS